MRVEFLPDAHVDFESSACWYAERSAETALRFIREVEATISRIVQNASSLAFVDERHQECRLKKFPFRIIFRCVSERIVVVALAHANRDPNYWQGR